MVGRDFNMVLHMSERSGMGTRMGEIEESKEMIDKPELVDLLLGGGR